MSALLKGCKNLIQAQGGTPETCLDTLRAARGSFDASAWLIEHGCEPCLARWHARELASLLDRDE